MNSTLMNRMLSTYTLSVNQITQPTETPNHFTWWINYGRVSWGHITQKSFTFHCTSSRRRVEKTVGSSTCTCGPTWAFTDWSESTESDRMTCSFCWMQMKFRHGRFSCSSNSTTDIQNQFALQCVGLFSDFSGNGRGANKLDPYSTGYWML